MFASPGRPKPETRLWFPVEPELLQLDLGLGSDFHAQLPEHFQGQFELTEIEKHEVNWNGHAFPDQTPFFVSQVQNVINRVPENGGNFEVGQFHRVFSILASF